MKSRIPRQFFWRRPFFTVVIATFNRDNLIVPTLESVRRQTFSDFEVLIVSDGTASKELKEVVKRFDRRFRLLELEERSRSQSGPNNLGWGLARGQYIAYLGHDDIWNSDHLQSLADVFSHSLKADFAVSGCLFIGPPGTGDELTWVTGIFEKGDKEAPVRNFFPPSSFSHRHRLPDGVRMWSDPTVTRRPVDTEFLLGAVESGCSFESTEKITVFKFASALRYLSYFCPENDEQYQMLGLLNDETALENFICERLDAAKNNGGYMATRHSEANQFMPGEVLRKNEIARGLAIPPVSPIANGKHLDAGDDHRVFDWHGLEGTGGNSCRWSGPNFRPRLLIPFTHSGPVAFKLMISRFASQDIHDSLQIHLNGTKLKVMMKVVDNIHHVTFDGSLLLDTPSVLELRMNRTAHPKEIDPDTLDTRQLGLCLLGIDILPATGASE